MRRRRRFSVTEVEGDHHVQRRPLFPPLPDAVKLDQRDVVVDVFPRPVIRAAQIVVDPIPIYVAGCASPDASTFSS